MAKSSTKEEKRPEPEPESEICGDCNGSGEGYVDGSRCIHCGGWGEVPLQADDITESEQIWLDSRGER
jgi:hypothetical protein